MGSLFQQLISYMAILAFLSLGCTSEGETTPILSSEDTGTSSFDPGAEPTDQGASQDDPGTEPTDQGSSQVDQGTTGPIVSYFEHARPILQTYCTPCHEASPLPEAGSGGHNIASHYNDAFKAASDIYPECAGKNVGECSFILASDQTMPVACGPNTDICEIPPAELSVIQAWVQGGMQP